MRTVAGVDIGGTKCAVSLGRLTEGDSIEIIDKVGFKTPDGPKVSMKRIIQGIHRLVEIHSCTPSAIGITCGGPLDSSRGVILSPPNLPGWDEVDVCSPLQTEFGVPVGLENDANACALAEWRWGAGRGFRNIIFLTFGTGMGAGLILNGQLYSGTNGMAGEVGHIRLEEDGPCGYGKPGSFEGFCSGSGIARLARHMAAEWLKAGRTVSFCHDLAGIQKITAEKVGKALRDGDPLAKELFTIVGRKLGKGIAVLVDVLNPERVIIGSIYIRQREVLEPLVREVLEVEALPASSSVCRVVPAGLGENVGDYASLSVAVECLGHMNERLWAG